MWLHEALTCRKIAGLLIGVAGVSLITWRGEPASSEMFVPAVVACLVASASYALGGVYLWKFVKGPKPMAIAAGSQMLAGLLLLPAALSFPVPGPLTPGIAAAVLALAILCTAIALILYFRLIADVGPTNAATVTFLIPLFGIVWGFLFLGEAITSVMIGGCALILAGTLLVTGFKLQRQTSARPPRAPGGSGR